MARLVLKVRAVSGALVPLNGEHVEYADLARAKRDAEVYALVSGDDVHIYDLSRDTVLEVITGALEPLRHGRHSLTAADWEEVYYAVRNKLGQIRQGEYGTDDDPSDREECSVGEWAAHLETILAKLGPDGEHMKGR